MNLSAVQGESAAHVLFLLFSLHERQKTKFTVIAEMEKTESRYGFCDLDSASLINIMAVNLTC